MAQQLPWQGITRISVENGLLQNSVEDVVADKYGFLWFSSAIGLQRYDGTAFQTITRKDGSLPSNRHIRFFPLSNGTIWLTHDKGISAYDPVTASFKNVLNFPIVYSEDQPQCIAEDEKSVWCLVPGRSMVQINKTSFQLISSFAFPDSVKADVKIFGTAAHVHHKMIYALSAGNVLCAFNIESKKFVRVLKLLKPVIGFLPLSDSTIVTITSNQYGLFNINTGIYTIIKPLPEAAENAFTSSRMLRLPSGKIVFGFNKDLYEIDPAGWTIQKKLSVSGQQTLLASGYIHTVYLDPFNTLWILTNSDGVKKITYGTQPFRYFGTANRKDNFIRTIYADPENNRLLAGTYGSGLLLFDNNGRLLKHIPYVDKGVKDITGIEKIGKDKYFIVAMGGEGFYYFDAAHYVFSKLVLKEGKPAQSLFGYYGNTCKINDSTLIACYNSLWQLTFTNEKIVRCQMLNVNTGVADMWILPDNKGNFWIGGVGKYILLNRWFQPVQLLDIPQNLQTRCATRDKAGNIWIGSEQGLFQLNAKGKIVKVYTKEDGLKDDGIYALQPDADGGVYCSHNQGISHLDKEGHIKNWSREAGLQENEFNTNATFQPADGTIYFGGVNGINAFKPAALQAAEEKPRLYITGINVMDAPWKKDTATWNVKKMELPYDKNIVSFAVSVLGSDDPGDYPYQYKMEGVDPAWVVASQQKTIRYVLPDGNYVFKIKPSNHEDKQATELAITIRAPFRKQWWFVALCAAAVVGLIVWAVYAYNRRQYLKRIRELEVEQKLQAERQRISRDLHDNLGSYATAIAANVDEIFYNGQQIPEHILQNLKDNAGEIMMNLRDTIWVLNKEAITITAISDKLKTYIQKIQPAYKCVSIEVKEYIKNNYSLRPANALNLFRIMQEALHNALKHSHSRQIIITINSNHILQVSIEDNGKGLCNENIQGNGLANMKQRALESGWKLCIEPAVPYGTRIMLTAASATN